MDYLTLKHHNFFQNQNKRKTTHAFASRPLIFKLEQEVLKFNEILSSSKPADEFIELRKSRF